MARLTIAAALADLAANYPTASATNPHVIALEPGTYTTPAFALPPFTFIVGDPDGPTDPTAATVISLTGNVTLASGWATNQTAFGGFVNVNLQQLTAANVDLTLPAPAAGNPARTIYLYGVRTNSDSLSYEATSTNDALYVRDLIHDGNAADAIEFSAGAISVKSIMSAAPILFNDTAAIAAACNIFGIYTMAAPSAVAPGVTFASSTGGVAARMGACDNRALTINRGGAAAITVYADAVSIPLTANITYAGTATSANLVATTDSGAVAPTGTFYGLNGQTIVGNSSGAWAVTANGLNQNITLTPSGTGRIAVGGSGEIRSTTTLILSAAAATDALDFATAGTAFARFAPTTRSLLLGTTTDSGNGILQLATHTTKAGGIGFGTATALFTNTAGRMVLDHIGGAAPFFQLAENGSIKAEFKTSSGNVTVNAAGGALLLASNNVTAILLDTSQNATFSGYVRGNKSLVTANSTTPITQNATTDNNVVFSNEGATALNVNNLPTAVAGLHYRYAVQDADGIQIVASAGDTIRIAGSVSSVAGNIQSTVIGSTVHLIAINATEWVSFATNGTWTLA